MKPIAWLPLVLKKPKTELSEALAELRQRLSSRSETPGLDAQVLLANLLDQDRGWLLAHPEEALSEDQLDRLTRAEQRLARGEPLPYLLGHWEFFGLDFIVTPDVLIPRPETELLVETAMAWLEEHPLAPMAVDVGSGSGCIAISLAANLPGLQVAASDISFAALQVARQNASRRQVADRVHFFLGDLLAPTHGPFDLVCANLPYIPSRVLAGLPVADHEPRLALDGGPDGLRLISRLLNQLASRLAPGGLALLEIEATGGPAALALARAVFPQAGIQVLKDLAGLDRLVRIDRE